MNNIYSMNTKTKVNTRHPERNDFTGDKSIGYLLLAMHDCEKQHIVSGWHGGKSMDPYAKIGDPVILIPRDGKRGRGATVIGVANTTEEMKHYFPEGTFNLYVMK